MRYSVGFWMFGFFMIATLSCSTKSTPIYELVTSAEPTAAGIVTPGLGEYKKGETVELSATANDHWIFERWEGDYAGIENPVSITMDTDKMMRAQFIKIDYPLTIEVTGNGSVNQQVVQPKTTEYPHGTVVQLTAVPENGWEFIRWEGDLEGTENPLSITVEDETVITAVFEKIEYPLTIHIVGEGEVNETVIQAKSTEYPQGTVVELEAIADENWIFIGWSGDLEGDENPKTITINESKEVTVTFERTFRLATISKPEEAGTVIPDSGVYIRNVSVDVEAVPNYGWSFSHWEGDFSGTTNPFNLTMNGNKTIVANFVRNEYELTINIEGAGNVNQTLLSGTKTSNGYLYESEVELSATPDDDSGFLKWDGDLTGDQNPETITMNSPKRIDVKFRKKIRKFGGDGYDEGNAIIRTTDNGYMVAGYSSSKDGDFEGLNKGMSDIFLMKFDESGNKEWIKNYGGSGTDMASNIIPSIDGGYLVTGETRSKDGDFLGLGLENYTRMSFKVDDDGNIEWITGIGGEAILQNSNGSIYVVGNDFIKELDQNGNLNWTANVDGHLYSLAINHKNELIVVGNRLTDNFRHVLFIKLNDEGNILQEEVLERGTARSVITTSDGGNVIIGASSSNSGVLYGVGIFILKKDANWNTEWIEITEPRDEDSGTSIIELPNSDLMLTGYTGYWSDSELIGDVYVAGFDRFGNKNWDQIIEDPPTKWPDYGRGYSLVPAYNGKAAVVTGISNGEIILFKISSDGIIEIMK